MKTSLIDSRYRKLRLFLGVLLGLQVVTTSFEISSSQAYYGKHSTEAILQYDAYLDVPEELTKKEIREQIQSQVSYLIGDFQSESFREFNGFSGMLGGQWDFQITRQAPSETYGNVRVFYSFEGKVLFAKKAFKRNQTTASIPIRLPVDLDLYYRIKTYRGKNYCTDLVNNGYSDFWYFWDPDAEQCPLRGDEKEVVRVTGHLKRLPNTQKTYPIYSKLYGDNGNQAVFETSVFFGYISAWNPSKAAPWDKGSKNYRDFVQEVKNLGFKTTEEKRSFKIEKTKSGVAQEKKGAAFFQTLEKETKTREGIVLARVHVLLSDTGFESYDETFHHYFVPALESSDIVIYDGHSELGEALDFENLPPVRFDPNKYQIYFFNGCNTYPYYNETFFKKKGGIQNLEIITSGLPTNVDDGAANTFAFLAPFLEGKRESYPSLISLLEASHSEESYLYGVNGDEDNEN